MLKSGKYTNNVDKVKITNNEHNNDSQQFSTKVDHCLYKTISQDEKDDIIVSFLHQQEMDHLCHSINKERYEKILNDRDISGEFKENIRKLRNEVETRIFEVEKIIEHTIDQLPSQERIDASVERTKEKAEKLNK
jgi:hypothetical protein